MNRPAYSSNFSGKSVRIRKSTPPMRFVALLLILSLLTPMTVLGHSSEPPSPFKTTLKSGPLSIGLNLLANWWNYATAEGKTNKEKPTAPSGRTATTAVVPTVAERLARMVKIETNAQKVSIEPGQEVALAAIPTDAQGNPLDGLKPDWLSSDPKIATVTDAGRVTGKAAGQTTIIAAIGEKRISIPVVVGGLLTDRPAKAGAGST